MSEYKRIGKCGGNAIPAKRPSKSSGRYQHPVAGNLWWLGRVYLALHLLNRIHGSNEYRDRKANNCPATPSKRLKQI